MQENIAHFVDDKWGGYWQTVKDGQPYTFRHDLASRQWIAALEARNFRHGQRIAELEARCAKLEQENAELRVLAFS